jgi:hypothetical protein
MIKIAFIAAIVSAKVLKSHLPAVETIKQREHAAKQTLHNALALVNKERKLLAKLKKQNASKKVISKQKAKHFAAHKACMKNYACRKHMFHLIHLKCMKNAKCKHKYLARMKKHHTALIK